VSDERGISFHLLINIDSQKALIVSGDNVLRILSGGLNLMAHVQTCLQFWSHAFILIEL